MLNVLLIEDDEIDAEAIRRTMALCPLSGDGKPSGANIFQAQYFQKGMEILRSNKKIDVVLLDLHLPDRHGSEMLRELCEQCGYAPVIVLTGINASDEQGVELVRAGAQDYIPKNHVSVTSLTRTILYAIERHHLHLRIERQARELRSINEELEAINEELETFTYITSHDLRSPLVNLKGFSSELHRSIAVIIPKLEAWLPTLPPAEREELSRELCQHIPKALSYIITAAEKMDRMTSAILKLSRLGRREIRFEPITTVKIVRQCLEALAYQIEKSQSTIEIEDLPDIVADRACIEQVFGNLLDNALKYLDPARPGHIRIVGFQSAGQVSFSIYDNGCGIAPHEMHKVFEIFRRASGSESVPGEGMGMAYVRTIVKRHGGNIWCDSIPGKGTAFHFTIASQQAVREAA